MNIHVPMGTYIIAVSGGVDSVVLLDVLSKLPGLTLVVAHVDHGIRPESNNDARFVEEIAGSHGYHYESIRLELGPQASEEQARTARYLFLRQVQQKYFADAIITAHHQDDVVETAILNMLRGTGRRGLSSLESKDGLIRPLLIIPKQELLTYAALHQLRWVEDITNYQNTYLRNHIRNEILATASESWKAAFLAHLATIRHVNHQLEHELSGLINHKIRGSKAVVSRNWFVKLDHVLACECMHSVLRKLNIANIDNTMVEQLVIALKVARPGSKIDINVDRYALITKRSLRFIDRKSLKTVAL